MDSHSRSASPREPMRPQQRPPSPPASPGAFDNRAFQHDEDPNHNDSFSSNPPQQNGQNGQSGQNGHKPNGDTKLEAVNLELINLTPKNGTKKKDVEVDLNTNNPYDEYFVPVNEHRKYMRGEKLYVTADKRGEKGGCKRPLCWTLLVLVVAAVVALIVLAATGVLFTNTLTTVEQYNSSISSARAFGNVIHTHDHHDHDHAGHDHTGHNHDHDSGVSGTPQDEVTTETTQGGIDTQNDEPHDHVAPEDDMSVYVPKTLEGQLKIDNEEFTPALEDPESNEYKEFVTSFTEGLKRAIFNRTILDSGDHDIVVEVIALKKGSLIVTYRVHWKPKANVGAAEDLLNAESLQTKLDNYLTNNNRMINIYHVAEDKLITKPVLDLCQIDNNMCEHGCEFDETTLEFTCTCPHGQILEISNPKKCISILDNGYPLDPNDDMKQRGYKVFNADDNTSTMKTTSENERTTHVENENSHELRENNQSVPESTIENEGDLNFSHLFGHVDDHTDEHEHITELLSPEPSSLPEPTAEPEPTTEPDAKPEPTPEAGPEPSPEPTTTHSSETIDHNDSSLDVIPSVKVNTLPATQTPRIVELEPETVTDPKAEPEPTAEPQPAAEPEPTAELQPAVEPEPTAEPQPATEPEPTAEPQPAAEPEPTAEPQPTAEPEPTTEPEPNAEPELTTEPKSAVEPEPSAEPQPEQSTMTIPVEFELKSQSESSSELKSMDKTRSEHKGEFDSKSNQSIVETSNVTEPEPEPNSELKTKNELVADRGTNFELEPKQTTEQNVEVEKTIYQKSNSGENLDFNYFQSGPTSKSNSEHIMPTLETKLESFPSQIPEEPTTVNVFSIDNNHFIETGSTTEHQPFNLETDKESQSSKSEEIDNNSEKKIQATEQNEPQHSVNTNMPNEPNDDKEVTTVKISIFEANSPQDKPPIMLSIISDTRHDVSSPENIETLERERNHTHINNDSEKRSFKSVDIIYADEMTTFNKANITEEKTSPVGSVMNENVEQEEKNSNTQSLKRKTIDNLKENAKATNIDTVIDSIINQGENVSSYATVTVTTEEPEVPKDYSISQITESNEENNLMDALLTKKTQEGGIIELTTEGKVDEGMDITFDTINMLYNRSSKSIEKVGENDNKTVLTQPAGPVVTTTESDWLSEPVTEINYDDAMNIMSTHTTTEAVAIDEVMKTGVTKDDFVPDYLNTNTDNHMNEDEPIYGMTSHDYDTEDSRVKRVQNTESSNITNSSAKYTIPQLEVTKQAPVEATTIVDYIYKSSEQTGLITTISPTTEISEPAPVWEESEKDITVKESPKQDIAEIPITTTVNALLDDKATTTSTSSPVTVVSETKSAVIQSLLPISTMPTLGDKNEPIESNNTDNQAQNATQVNNLNVTIYEISSHNNSVSVPKIKTQSSEYDDHETEMNPFLPEVENNKVLVKKLQEGHDLEPVNLNETQNENIEEHKNISDSSVSNTKDSNDNIKEEHETTFTDFMATNTQNMSSMTVEEKPKRVDKESLPTFLLDTDDLDTSAQKPTNSLESSGSTPQSIESNDDSEYLSVVPIEEERIDSKEALKRNYVSKNIQELNDISDSPKKSDRRTIHVTKYDTAKFK